MSETAGSARLFISADSDYAAWLNGEFIGAGQQADFPQRKTYDVLTIDDKLSPNETNTLCVLAYYEGDSSFRYRHGPPGLIYTLVAGKDRISSGRDALCRVYAAYRNGRVPRITRQIGFSFEYDAQRADNWTDRDYGALGDWRHARTEIARNFIDSSLHRRATARLEYRERASIDLCSQGVFLRSASGDSTIAALMQHDYLSFRQLAEVVQTGGDARLPTKSGLGLSLLSRAEGTGIYLVLDFGQETCGVFDLEVESGAGVVIDIGYGQHLDDLRVRTSVGGRNFAARYTTRTGRQRFTHYFRRWSGRYVQLHVTNPGPDFVIYYAGMITTEYPLIERGELHGLDALSRRIERVAIRTLRLCMHEHYEDTPWREQALYAMDARNQALCGYYAFGEYDFPEVSLQLLGETLREDGFLDLCAPAETKATIPVFSFHWVAAVAEHLLYSGRIDAARRLLPIVRRIMGERIHNLRDGLLPTPEGAIYWNFYDWAPGLNGRDGNDPLSRRLAAPLNLLFASALDKASAIERGVNGPTAITYDKTAKKIKGAIHATFWDAEEGAYRTYADTGERPHYAELVQALALTEGVCPEQHAGDVRRRLAARESGLVPVSLSQSLAKLTGLLGEPETYGEMATEYVSERWGSQLFAGASSFWETDAGADDFGGAGSLCHGWSAVPVCFYYRHFLGVVPIEPGFRTFRVEPLRTAAFIGGRVPTPYGEIDIACGNTKTSPMPTVSHPATIRRL